MIIKNTLEIIGSDEQVKKVKVLQDKQISEMQANMEKNKEARKAKMAEMQKKREAHDAEMKKILTPEQYQKWDAERKAKMEKRKEMMKDRAGKDGFGKRKMMKMSFDVAFIGNVFSVHSNCQTFELTRSDRFLLLEFHSGVNYVGSFY